MKTFKVFLALSVIAVACASSKAPTVTTNVVSDTQSVVTPITATPVQTVEVAAIANPGGPDTSKWVAPAESDAVKNPIASDEESIADGMAVFKRNCRSCHGRAGDGQGVGAADCTVPPPSFLTETFKKQSDGAIFWKITTGRNDMKSYKDEIDDEDIWKVINYIKSLKAAE